MDVLEIIKGYALQNALKFSGRANEGAVLGKVISAYPELKQKIKKLKEEVLKIVRDVNSLSLEEQKKLFEEVKQYLPEKKSEKKKTLLPLPKTKKLVMRFEPSPSGPLHIGHAYVLSLNSEYCRMYNGKLILRIGDTNPENIYKPSYRMIEEDARWLTKNNIAEVIIQSERLEIYYNYMEKLLRIGKAYICTCPNEEFKKLIAKRQPCPCRNLPKEEQFERWKMMFCSYKQGEAVARIKTDIGHKNPAMRDWPAFRINDTPHPRQNRKYRVWPLMNMAVVVDDIELGVTHVIRAKDHADNAKRQEYVYRYLKKKVPYSLFVGRINFIGFDVSTTNTRKLIESGYYSGWDDIRLPFLPALRRRGYQPDAFVRYAVDVGITLNDKTVSMEEFFKTINAFNRDIIDPYAPRYFFVENPVLIKIKEAPCLNLELDLHPDNKKGGRFFNTHEEFYITKQDAETLRDNELYRLMGCINFIKFKGSFIFDSEDYENFKRKGRKIMHWLPKNEPLLSAEVVMPDNTVKRGLIEANASKLETGEVVQLERFGFARLDKKLDKKLIFWYLHN